MTNVTTIQAARPNFTLAEVEQVAATLYNLTAKAQPLPSERDQNFRLLTPQGEQFVLKIANATERRAILDLQNQAMAHLHHAEGAIACPQAQPARDGARISEVKSAAGTTHFVRLLSYLPGAPLATIKPQTPTLLRHLGQSLGHMDKALLTFEHPAARREFHWDLRQARMVVRAHHMEISDPARRGLINQFLHHFETQTAPQLAALRQSVVHNDGNDYNILVAESGQEISGIIDFGDLLHSFTLSDLAIATAYIMFEQRDPLGAAAAVVRGYHEVLPLSETELAVLYPLITMRLCTSVTLSAHQRSLQPDNEYLSISEAPAWALLERLSAVTPHVAHNLFRAACGMATTPPHRKTELLQRRQAMLGPSLSLSYDEPLHIVRGQGQYLYDETGRAYLDGVNNVAHVGHCHPRVVAAGQQQMAQLNTNTRYLHENIIAYAERLCAMLPDPLNVCYFVCSGSEANELALRMARTHTQQHNLLVVEGAYHGNTTALIEISPYKFAGRGGQGAPPYVHQTLMPDGYRGPYKGHTAETGQQYAAEVQAKISQIQAQGRNLAAFFCESLLSCGGQIVLPPGYLAAAYEAVRAAGGVCVADEVQVGFGRVGSHFWGFELQGVVPDIVTMGKPIGNGHPLAAVVTTPEIAASFNNGMEYFNTFGGNPVSCAIGLAVLEVIEMEKLQQQAHTVGDYLQEHLKEVQTQHALIGDVRGAGLFIGLELVRNQQTLEPAAAEAHALVQAMQARGILLSTDGPLHNVIKMKPPLVFNQADADFLVDNLVACLSELT